MEKRHFPVALQLELMAVLWAILSVLIIIAGFLASNLFIKIGGFFCIIIAIIYFMGAIYKTKRKKPQC